MPFDSCPPDKILDETDRGDDTQRRFRYQAALAALISLDLLREDSEFEEIFCEHHEDVLVRRKDGGFIGYQVKTRKLGRGPLTFNSPEVIRALERFIISEKTFSKHFKRYVIAANCGFSKKRIDYRNLEYCFRALRGDKAELILLDGAFRKKIMDLSCRTGCSEDFVVDTLRKVWVQEAPGIEEYEVCLADQIAKTTNVNQSHLLLRQASTSLIETMLQAASLTHSSPRSTYFALLSKPDSARTDAIIEGKRITRATVKRVLDESLGLAKTSHERTARFHERIDFSKKDAKTIDDSFKKYASRITSDYNNFSAFERKGVKPLIEYLFKFDLKKHFIPIKLKSLSTQRIDIADKLITEWIEKDSINGLFILGDFGTGKSTLCAHISYRLAYTYLKKTNARIPIFIPLRYVEEISKDSILRVINEVIKIDWATLSGLSKSGKLVLIFDGFDEIIKRTDWKKILADFQAIVKLFCEGKSKVIVGCRTHYFLKDSVIWGAKTELMESLEATKNFRMASMQPFNEGQILDLLRRRTKNPNSVWNQIRETYNLKNLCTRPLLLDMIVTTLPKLVSLGSSINATTLYDMYTSEWISREDWRSQLTPDQKAELMEKIACDMFVQGKAEIPFHDFKNIIEREFKTKPESEVVNYYDYDIRTCSFFNRDTDGNYSFMHRSFGEFFVAKAIARKVNFEVFPDFLRIKPLPDEIAYFAGLMIKPDGKKVLLGAILKTKGKSLKDAGWFGGNALRLVAEISESLEGEDFSRCAIDTARLSSYPIRNCKFKQVKLRSIDFDNAEIGDCDFRESHLDSCNFANVKISNTSFIETRLVGSKFMESEFFECDMNNVAFERCRLTNVKLIGLDLTGARFHETSIGLKDVAVVEGVTVLKSNLQSAEFYNTNLLLSVFHKSILHGAHFVNCDLGGTCIIDCDVSSARIDGGSMSFAGILDSKFDNSLFDGTRFFRTYMNESEMKSATFKQTSVKVNETNFHHLVGLGTDTKVKFDPNLPAFCALNRVVEKFSISDSSEEETIQKFLSSWDSFAPIRIYGKTAAIAAWLYAVTKGTDRPRTLKEIGDSIGVYRTTLAKLYRDLLKKGLTIRVRRTPHFWVETYAKELKITRRSVALAKEIIDLACKPRALQQGKSASSIASGALHLACKVNSEEVTQISIATVAGLTATTVRSTSRLLSKFIPKSRKKKTEGIGHK